MSGDVQPRNCKDKRRKRDDEEERPTRRQHSSTTRGASLDHTDNLTIHIHKDTGTGGHWCARIIFFVVLAGLLGTIGLIIVEHRGTPDVDSPVKASQWVTTFESWIDEALIFHEEKEELKEAVVFHEHNDNDKHDDVDENSHEINEKENKSLENKKEESVEEFDTMDDAGDDSDCFTLDEMIEEKEALFLQDNIITEEESKDDSEANQSDDDTLEDDDKEETEEEVNQYLDDSIEPQFNDVTKEKDQVDDTQNSDEDDESYSEENLNNDLEDFGALEEIEYGIQFTNNGNDYNKFNEENIEDFDAISEMNEMDNNSAEPLEEIDSEESEETINKIVHFEDEIKEELEEESTNVAMKFGIGIALIVTAHFVLVRRWNNDNKSKEYIEDIEHMDSETNEDEEFEDNEEFDNNEETEDEEEEEEEEDEEVEEDEEEEEEEEDEDEEDEEEEHFQDINDTVLIEKLDKKYGKVSDLTFSKEKDDIINRVQEVEKKEAENYQRKDKICGRKRK